MLDSAAYIGRRTGNGRLCGRHGALPQKPEQTTQEERMFSKYLSLGAGIAAAAIVTAGAAQAQTGAAFYKGKTVTYIVSTAPGGGYDTYGRLIAEYMQRNLP